MAEPRYLQLIYASAATEPFSDDDLTGLLEVARRKNTVAGVTGMLLYDSGSFLQVLEGPEEAVLAVYSCISQDPRHEDTTLLYRAEVETRDFDEWAMGFARTKALAKEQLPGWNSFMQTGFRGDADDDAERAIKLLFAFRGGRFHRHVA